MTKERLSKKQSRDAEELVEHNIGIIAQNALKYWRKLPPHVRVSYELEDMIAELTLHVVRKSTRYNAEVARPTTFVFRVTENKCRDILTRHYRQKNTAQSISSLEYNMAVSLPNQEGFMEPVEDVEEPVEFREPEDERTKADVYNDQQQLQVSARSVELLISQASQRLRDWISATLRGQRRAVTPEISAEFQEICTSIRLTCSDFSAVCRAL